MMLQPFVQISGQGPALVLLHGWGLHGGIWETIKPQLEAHFTLHIIDLPGFGRSPVYNGDYDLDYLVDSVIQVLPEKSNLLGWSLGGLVATAVALKVPAKIERLITAASNPCFITQTDWPCGMSPAVLNQFINLLEEDFEGTLIRFLGLQTMGSPTQKTDINILKEAVFLHGQPAQKALRGGLEILQQNDLSQKITQLTMPLLRLYGRLDSLVPVKTAEHVDKLLPGSISKVYRRAAHAPFLSAGKEFVDDLSAFILKTQPVSG